MVPLTDFETAARTLDKRRKSHLARFKHINLKDPFILHAPAKTDHLQNLPPLQLGFHGQAGLSLLFEASEGSLHRYASCYVE